MGFYKQKCWCVQPGFWFGLLERKDICAPVIKDPAVLSQMLKKLHLEPKNSSESWSSCCWRPGSAFTHHPWGLRRGQGHSGLPKQLSFFSNFTFSYSRCGSLLGGRQGYGTLEFSIPQLSVVQQTHSDSSLGQCNTMIQGHQALRGGPKNL